jgi:hypothetical protein
MLLVGGYLRDRRRQAALRHVFMENMNGRYNTFYIVVLIQGVGNHVGLPAWWSVIWTLQ